VNPINSIHSSIGLFSSASLQPGDTAGIKVMPELGKQAAVWKAEAIQNLPNGARGDLSRRGCASSRRNELTSHSTAFLAAYAFFHFAFSLFFLLMRIESPHRPPNHFIFY